MGTKYFPHVNNRDQDDRHDYEIQGRLGHGELTEPNQMW
jgi:hypothetical protein